MKAANKFNPALVERFGNANTAADVQTVIDTAKNSGSPQASALAQAYEAGVMNEIDCDQLFEVAKTIEDEGTRKVAMDAMSRIRKDLRWNAGFGEQMRGFKPEDKELRFNHARGLLANIEANGARVGVISANNALSQAPTLDAVDQMRAALTSRGVQLNGSTETVVLSKAVELGDIEHANQTISMLTDLADAGQLDQRTTKIFTALKAKAAALQAAA